MLSLQEIPSNLLPNRSLKFSSVLQRESSAKAGRLYLCVWPSVVGRTEAAIFYLHGQTSTQSLPDSVSSWHPSQK